MKTHSPILHFAYLFLLLASLKGEETIPSILVSVAGIDSAEQSSSGSVQIIFTAHEPSTVRSAQLYTICDSVDRAKVREEYPLSGLFTLLIPRDLFNELKAQKEKREKDQSTIDKGIDPKMISNLVIIPKVDFSLIKKSIARFEQSENSNYQ